MSRPANTGPVTSQQRNAILKLMAATRDETQHDFTVMTYYDAAQEIKRLSALTNTAKKDPAIPGTDIPLIPGNHPNNSSLLNPRSEHEPKQALVDMLFTLSDAEAPDVDVFSDIRIRPRDIIGVPWVCVGAESKEGENGTYYIMSLYFQGIDKPYKVAASGGWMNNELDVIARRCSIERPCKGTFELAKDVKANYTPPPARFSSSPPSLAMARWRSRRGLTDVAFVDIDAEPNDDFPF